MRLFTGTTERVDQDDVATRGTDETVTATPSDKPAWTSHQKLVAALIGAGALGLILPWVRVLFIEASGLDIGDGQLYGMLLLATAVLSWHVVIRGNEGRWMSIANRACGTAAACIAAFALGEVTGTDIASPGGGLLLSVASAIALMVVLLRRDTGPRTKATVVIACALVVVSFIGGNASAEDFGDPFDFDESSDADAADAVSTSIGEEVSVEGATLMISNVRGGFALDFMGDRTSDRVIIFEVAVTNDSDEDEYFDPSDFQIETPAGTIESASFSQREGELDANLAPGGSSDGTVEFDHAGPGVYTLRYTPGFEPLITLRVQIDDE